ncbi:MAG: DNA polymerase III subunit alpha [Deltaproteobacteria bacterium]|nr:DNA polymerase III subunit alpha [Deltaproteobacteria bacterium]
MDFVHLHCHTQYSLLDGAIKTNDLIDTTLGFGQKAVAITDHGVMYGAIEFYDKATKAGLKPIIGCEVYVAPGDMETKTPIPGLPRYFHLVLLAMNSKGYKNLIKLVSIANTKGFYHKPRVDKTVLREYNSSLIAMSACLQGEIPYWILRGNEDKAVAALDFYRSTFEDRFYLEIQANGLADQEKVNPVIVEMAKKYSVPLVATNDCHYLKSSDAKAHEVLLCIQTRKTINDKDRMRFNTDQLYLKSPQEMMDAFSWIPEAISNTKDVADRCSLEIPMGTYHFPVFPAEGEMSLESTIEEKARLGLARRLGDDIPPEYSERLEDELNIIKSMGFPGYFLIVADYINYAKTHGIPVGPGRGSAAGSLVAYALGITDIDPIRWGLLFERFLNPERKSMPDIDVDFCQERRDEVIEYVKNKYGYQYVGQITTFGNMKAKAVIRDVGRVLGISYSEVDKIAKLVPDDPKITIDKALELEPRLREMVDTNPVVAELTDIARSLEGLSRHASVHAGGVVISDRFPLTDHVPVYLDKKGMLISQYDKDSIEKVGLIKFDLLGLKTLTVIHKTLEILKSRGETLDLSNLPLDDPLTYKLMGDGDTAGVFQLESHGMKQMLMQLKPEKFEDVIAAVALYRPGPMDLIPSYIDRKHGKEKIEYLHPMLEPILKETYGIIIYQEQVMQIAQVMAGYSLGKADLLRRAMGKKKVREMDNQREDFIKGAKHKGVSEDLASQIFSLMAKFAGYGFNKSHAAAYALVAYQTAYLKAHYFNEFMAANLTLDLGNKDKKIRYLAECRVKGIEILNPDINESKWEFVTTTDGIRFGLGAIKHVGKGAVDMIVNERSKRGPFKDFQDFIHRINTTKVNKRIIESLIKTGCFDQISPNRRSLMEVLDDLMDNVQKSARNRYNGQKTLFDIEGMLDDKTMYTEIPEIPDWSETEKLQMERELTEVYISSHPLQRYKDVMKQICTTNTNSIQESPGTVTIAGILQGLNTTRTKKGEIMARAILEDLHGTVPVIFFPTCYNEYTSVISSVKPIVIKARVGRREEDNGNNQTGQIELIAEEVYTIEGATSLAAKEIHLRLPPDIAPNSIKDLKDLVSRCKGEYPLYLEVQTEDAVIEVDAGKDYKVNPSSEFMSKVKEIIGASGIELR